MPCVSFSLRVKNTSFLVIPKFTQFVVIFCNTRAANTSRATESNRRQQTEPPRCSTSVTEPTQPGGAPRNVASSTHLFAFVIVVGILEALRPEESVREGDMADILHLRIIQEGRVDVKKDGHVHFFLRLETLLLKAKTLNLVEIYT